MIQSYCKKERNVNKVERKLKIVLCVLLIVLITLIAFAGVYSKDTVIFKERLPKYALASEFEEKRIVSFKLSEEEREIIYDKDGKEVDSIPEGANEEEYTKKKEKVNLEEAINAENFKKAKEIFTARLEAAGVEDYKVRLDETNGNITVEFPNELKTDTWIQYLQCKGDFSITDSKDGTVLIDKSDVKESKVLYRNDETGGIMVYFDIVFNKEGKQKLLETSKVYMKVENESDKNQTNEVQDNNTVNENQKQVVLTIEGTPMLTTYFGEEMPNGELPISIGTASDAESLQSYVEQGNFYAMLINNPDMPLTYTVSTNETVIGNLEETGIFIAIVIVAAIFIILSIYMIIRFKLDGIISVLSNISWIAILLLAVRYTGTEISLNSATAMIILIILNTYLLNKMLKNIKQDNSYENVAKETIRTYLKNADVIVITLVISIVFTFMNKAVAFSFGMTLFYGIISVGISNLVFLRSMLLAKYNK